MKTARFFFVSDFVNLNHFGGAFQEDGINNTVFSADGDFQGAATVVGGQHIAGELSLHPQDTGGAAGAGLAKEIMALAEKIDGYIGCSFMGLSTMSNSYERFLGMEGMHGHYASSMANKEADLVIGIGVRFSDRVAGNAKKFANEISSPSDSVTSSIGEYSA